MPRLVQHTHSAWVVIKATQADRTPIDLSTQPLYVQGGGWWVVEECVVCRKTRYRQCDPGEFIFLWPWRRQPATRPPRPRKRPPAIAVQLMLPTDFLPAAV